MDDIPNICDGNDKMSKSVWTSVRPTKSSDTFVIRILFVLLGK